MEELKEANNISFNTQVALRLETPERLNTSPGEDIKEDLLDKCPPDFEWARKHQEANTV